MNFEKYFNNRNLKGYLSRDERISAKIGWDACKQEILKVLNEYSLENMSGIEVDKLLNKIEDL